MSRLANSIMMLTLLMSRGKMNIKELADKLEVSKSMVRKYKDDLEQVGIYLNSESGKYGGYTLDKSNFLGGLNITHEDKLAISMAQEYLKNINFVYLKEFDNFSDKINCIYVKNEIPNKNISFYAKNIMTNCNIEYEREKQVKIMDSILTSNKLELEYFSLTSGASKRIVHPYAIYEYKGDLYLAAYCELKKKILDFKFIRIKMFKKMDEKFIFPKDFTLKEVLRNCIGIYKDKEYDIILRISGNMAHIISEKIWVDNQKVTWHNDNSITFQAKMRGLTEIKSWILGMGSDVKIIEPEHLRTEIIKEINKMKNIYLKC